MEKLRFDGRTAVVTGAGGNPSMGRCHAMLLAERGANVVVNDIGDPGVPRYEGVASAEAVVAEIVAAGGKAVASTHSVASEDGAQAIVQTALDAFGSIDILVNNAAVSISSPIYEMSSEHVRRHVEVNLLGQIWLVRAAWPHMRAAGYGRIVNIGSGAFAGMVPMTIYGATKGGVFSLTRGIALEGEPFGIKANTVHPGAFTRMLTSQHAEESSIYQFARDNLPPERTSPLVAYLAHESCPVTGETFDALGGDVRRIYVAQTQGIQESDLTVERLAARWDEVMGHPVDLLSNENVDTSTWVLHKYEAAQAGLVPSPE
ncbi:MAG: SDR family NAD(P)-dependent oxidoreductase [Hyphomicrobiales bacterium]|nr:MAG: SDR family NAD(P)-dependent oxidoreductase [Hyphomicrobiales bacterium]